MIRADLNTCGEVCSSSGCDQSHGCAARRDCAPGLCEGLHTCSDHQCHGHPDKANGTDRAPINWTDGLVAALFCFSMWHLASDKAESMAAERDARELCTAELGPGAQALWTHQGDLVCRPATLTAESQP